MNDKANHEYELNIDKITAAIEPELAEETYKCPYAEAQMLLEKIKGLRSQDDLRWIETAAQYYALYSHCLLQDGNDECGYSKLAYKIYAWMSEGSRYLQTLYPQDIAAKREEIEKGIERLRTRQSALSLIRERQTSSFISNMIYRLKTSDYILFPNRRSELLACFLAYDKELVKNEFSLISEAIYQMNRNGLVADDTNLLIQKTLQREIEEYETIISGLWYTESREILEMKIKDAVRLIALTLLNSRDSSEEKLDRRVLSARICRYLSFLDTSLSTLLKNKAYTILTGECTLDGRIGWDDLMNFDLLQFIAQIVNIHIDELNAPAKQEGKWEQFDNGHNTLTLDKDGFTLSTSFTHRSWRGRKEKVSLMDNRVFMASFSKPTFFFQNCRSIADFQLYWRQFTDDYPLFRASQPDIPSLPLQDETEEDTDTLTLPDEELTMGTVGTDPTGQYLEGIILDEKHRGKKAFLPLEQINAAHMHIPNFGQYFTGNSTYAVKATKACNGHYEVTLTQSYDDFMYAENIKRKEMPAMIIGYEGTKIKWMLITGTVCTTPTNRWIKPVTGDIYQVQYTSNILKTHLSIEKTKSDISHEVFFQELHNYLQDFFTHLCKFPNANMERKAQEESLKIKNNPLAHALQSLNMTPAPDTNGLETILPAENDTAFAAPDLPIYSSTAIDGHTARELIFCLDQLAKEAETPEEQFNAYNFLRLLSLFAGEKDLSTYYELCAEYIYCVNQIAVRPSGERFSPNNIQRFNILSARMEQLGIPQYATTFGPCIKTINTLRLMANKDTVHLQQLIQDEDKIIAELARYFCMSSLLTENDGELQHIIYRNINMLLGFKEPQKTESAPVPVFFGHEGVDCEFKSSAFLHSDKNANEDQALVLTRVIASFMNTDGGTLYIGVNDKGYLIGIQEDMKLVHNDCDIYLRTVNSNILQLLGKGKKDFNRYQEYIRCDIHEYGKNRMVLAFHASPINEVVEVNGKIYTRSGSSCICKPQELADGFIATRRNMKLDSIPHKPKFPTVFSEEKNEYCFGDEPAPAAAPMASPAPSLFDNIAESTAPVLQEQPPLILTKPKTKAVLNILSSTLRPNPLQKKADLGYTSTYQFVSLFGNGKIASSPSPKIGVWGEKGGKVFCSYDTEGSEEWLVSVFTTGEVGISNLKKGFSSPNTLLAFIDNVDKLMFCSPASKDKYLLLVAEKDGVKRYRIIRLSDFGKPLGIQPKLYQLLVPEKGSYIFAEILDDKIMEGIEDDKTGLDSFDQYNAGHFWEHTSYKKGLEKISEMCNLPF